VTLGQDRFIFASMAQRRAHTTSYATPRNQAKSVTVE
jgi:hypothetical protein